MALAPPSHGPAIELIQRLEAYGSGVDERSDLVALAGVESNWDWSAVGDEGRSHGMFQAERAPGVEPSRQVEHAVTLYREILDSVKELRKLNDTINKRRSGAVAVRLDGPDRLRLVRAAWQLPSPARAIKDWAAALRPIVDKVSSKEDDPDWRLVNDGGGLTVQSFIDWYCTENPKANKAALERGQKVLDAFGRITKWSWLQYFKVPAGPGMTPVTSDYPGFFSWCSDKVGEGLDAVGRLGSSLARGVSRGVSGIGSTLEFALPVVMVGLPLLLAARWLLGRREARR